MCQSIGTIHAEAIPGDIVECGVWSGGSLALAALWDLQYSDSKRIYHAFDSFEGLPPPTEDDGAVFENFNTNSRKKNRIATQKLQKTGVCAGDSADTVRMFFHKLGIPADRSRFHVGWFQDTVPAAAREIGPLSILRIDGDWYDSTKVCLDHLYDIVSPGGYVIVDDYGCFSGCKRAVDEFMAMYNIKAQLTFVDDHCVWFRKP
ncbi:MAG: TylF/MycF/NovP-related O-methyltransferase [Sphingomonadaceae bacterium]